jgi:ubiquinone/menaquinone biosynthesis C-methylase UbiE
VLRSRDALKSAVKEHWEKEPCNTRYSSASDRRQYFAELNRVRYRLEPNIEELARFSEGGGKRVLEIGIGYGIDFCNWVRAGADATGVDLTEAAIALTREHLDLDHVSPDRYTLMTADAENLPLPDSTFDIAYAYGSLHHTPDTRRAFREAARVLKPGGELRAMIYHSPSWTAINLWLYHGLLKLRPWRSLKQVVYDNLESPGTKVYTVSEATALLAQAGLEPQEVSVRLDCGDLMEMKLSAKYERNPIVRLAMMLYPRPLIRAFGNRLGNTMHLVGKKPPACAE